MEQTSALSKQKDTTTFRCRRCSQNHKLKIERVEERPDLEPHPFEYFAHCPGCGAELVEAPFIKSLYKAWLNPTGTGSPEISAKNLPPPNDPRRKFNALKTGLFAKKAKYFPAMVGRYPECDGCQHANICEEGGVCLEISKVRMMVSHAFDSKDPAFLQPLFQDLQADVFILLQRLILRALQDGVILDSPVWSGTKESYVLVQDAEGNQIMQHELHPAIRAISELFQKNGLSLADLQLTPKTQADHAATMGHLAAANGERVSAQEHRQLMAAKTDQFLKALAGATAARARDPIFQEHQEEAGVTPADEN